MDQRILGNLQIAALHRTAIPELDGWQPGAPALHATSPVRSREPVSLIVPTFFNSQLKQQSLRHLLEGLTHSQAVQEIILVASDGGPSDFDALRALAPGRPFHVVPSDPQNRGKSRNAGAAAASSPFLLFLDDDMLLRDWRGLDALVSQLLDTAQDGALFPRRHYARFPLLYDPPALQEVIDQWRQDPAAEHPFLYDPLRQGARDLPMLFCFPGCFMLIRRDAFLRLDGFKEEFIGWGFEDTEFGLRAIRELRILNLFRQGEPLLHIDHPVSPYKTDEHNANWRKFYASAASLDINHFCRVVFRGHDFPAGSSAPAPDGAALLAPFRQLTQQGIPVSLDSMKPWCLRLARQRLEKCLGPLPRFVVLHGSRAEGAGEFDDDYDVLALYDGGIQDFFVSDGSPRVEVECADLHRFEHIAAHPAQHSVQGPMELAKLAGARLLWGDAEAWRQWAAELLSQALGNGWCFWLVHGLGMRAHVAKYGPMVDRFFGSLAKLCAARGAALRGASRNDFDFADKSTVSQQARAALQEFRPDWREKLAAGEPIFELQVPEVWIALHRLARMPNGQPHPLAPAVRRPEPEPEPAANGSARLAAARSGR